MVLISQMQPFRPCAGHTAEGREAGSHLPALTTAAALPVCAQLPAGDRLVELHWASEIVLIAAWLCRRYVRNNLLKAGEQRCAMTTVSALIGEHSLERVDLLKIDVEGAELDVLRGIDQKDWPTIRQVSNTAPILSEV